MTRRRHRGARALVHALVLVLALGPVHAQVAVCVRDADTREAVPFANISWTVAGTVTGASTDAAGNAVLGIEPGEGHRHMMITVASLGYATTVDTLTSTATRTIFLRPVALQLQAAVITGQYAPTRADNTVQRSRVICAEAIRQSAAESLGDLLRRELNMNVQQDNQLGASLSMQGLGGENVKVLVDGVAMIGRLNGSIDLSRIDLSGVERVEIVEGPMSVSYGTNALAGTINLITRKGASARPSLDASTYAEHLGRLNLAASAAGGSGRAGIQFTLGHNFFGGWDPRQGGAIYDPTPHVADSTRVQQWKPREQDFARLACQWRLHDRWTVAYKAELAFDRIIARGAPRAPWFESAFDERHDTRQLDNAAFVDGSWGRSARVNAQFAHQRYRRERTTWLNDLTTLDERSLDATASGDTTRFTLSNARMSYTNRADSAHVRYEIGVDLNVETGAGGRIDGNGERIGDHALFTSCEWRPLDGLAIRPGLRAAYNTKFQAPVVPSLNVLWKWRAKSAVRAGWAQGFRAPSLKELYLFFVDVNHDLRGNPDLHAERSDHFELSMDRTFTSVTFALRGEAASFYNLVRDRIALANVSGPLYTYANVGRVTTRGITARLGGTWKSWSLGTGATITEYRDDVRDDAGNAWIRTPQVQLALGRKWMDWRADFFCDHHGESVSYTAINTGEVGTSRVGSYTTIDASVTRTFSGERLTIALGCKNIGDVTDVEAVIAEGAHGSSGGVVPMATGRTYFLRIDLHLERSGKR